jgi:hypothetical protein
MKPTNRPLDPRLLVLLGSLLVAGCYRGYKSADELETDERGPTACAQSCRDLNMQMSAFVLVEHGTSGCVCSPVTAPPTGGSAAAAAGHVLLEQQREQHEQQARAQTSN